MFLKNETTVVFSLPEPRRCSEEKRGSNIGLDALVAVGLFGGGLAVVGGDKRGLRGLCGQYQDQTKASMKSLRRSANFPDYLTVCY